MLSPHDHERVATAVATADAATSGEIVCVLAREVSNYREVPLAFAVAAALIVPPILLMFGVPAHALTMAAPWVGAGSWTVGVDTPPEPAALIAAYALTQVIIFALVAALVAIPPVRRLLTPEPLRRHRVHKAALQQFLATGLHASPTRTGVVIFAAMDDRRVELLADDIVHEAVGEKAWQAAIAAVQHGMKRGEAAGGLIRAVELCGGALAEHFPLKGAHAGVLGDGVLEI
jgi:putative membrane protein